MRIREAGPADRSAIVALQDRARYRLPRLWPWEEHLGKAPFVVVERGGRIVGAFSAWADASSPVAWVRLAALDRAIAIDVWLQMTLVAILDRSRRLDRPWQALAWMDYGGWAGPHLQAQGFEPLADVITLLKRDRRLPHLRGADVDLSPPSRADVAAVVAVDRAAFTPPWWHGEAWMRRRVAQADYFAVARLAGEIVGYAEGELRDPTAHLNRIAVSPAHQGRGIGAALLRDALRAFWRQGASRVALNTQSHNRPSRRLYRRFGFTETGDRMTAWRIGLKNDGP